LQLAPGFLPSERFLPAELQSLGAGTFLQKLAVGVKALPWQ